MTGGQAAAAGGSAAGGVARWRLVLASASPARLVTLRQSGVDPLVQVSSVDEEAMLAETGVSDPEDVPLLLARAKAEDVAAALSRRWSDHPGPADDGLAGADGAIVLGCDSVLDLDGVALGKPADAAAAVLAWQQMRGRTGVLRTGHWLIDLRPGRPESTPTAIGRVSATSVQFADLSDHEIAAYVATGEPLQVAGAFTVDGLGGAFVTGIDGDYHGVVGVSLPLLRELLGQFGVSWIDMWNFAA
jgi:septum formation protein